MLVVALLRSLAPFGGKVINAIKALGDGHIRSGNDGGSNGCFWLSGSKHITTTYIHQLHRKIIKNALVPCEATTTAHFYGDLAMTT